MSDERSERDAVLTAEEFEDRVLAPLSVGRTLPQGTWEALEAHDEALRSERDRLREAVEPLRAWRGRTFSTPTEALKSFHDAAMETVEALDATTAGGG